MGTAVCVAGATQRTFCVLVERRGLPVLARAMGCLPMVVADVVALGIHLIMTSSPYMAVRD